MHSMMGSTPVTVFQWTATGPSGDPTDPAVQAVVEVVSEGQGLAPTLHREMEVPTALVKVNSPGPATIGSVQVNRTYL